MRLQLQTARIIIINMVNKDLHYPPCHIQQTSTCFGHDGTLPFSVTLNDPNSDFNGTPFDVECLRNVRR